MEGLRRYWPMLLIALGLIGGALWWQDKRAEERRVEEQLAQAQGIVRVLSATFSNKAALKVGEINGTLDVTVVDPGAVPLLRSSQKATVPSTSSPRSSG
jgi:hypothetical protein